MAHHSPARQASPPTAIATTREPIDLEALAIVGIRRDGAAIVIIESDAGQGAREHRCTTERELWLAVAAIADRHGAQIVDGGGSARKRERARLSEAFGVLIRRGREHAAERVGEDTVGAVETIGEIVGGKAVAGLRRISTRGSSSLGRRARALGGAK